MSGLGGAGRGGACNELATKWGAGMSRPMRRVGTGTCLRKERNRHFHTRIVPSVAWMATLYWLGGRELETRHAGWLTRPVVRASAPIGVGDHGIH